MNISFTLDLGVLGAAAAAILIGIVWASVLVDRWSLTWSKSDSLQKTEEFIKSAASRRRWHAILYFALVLSEASTVVVAILLARGRDAVIPCVMLAVYLVMNAFSSITAELDADSPSILAHFILVIVGTPAALIALVGGTFNATGVLWLMSRAQISLVMFQPAVVLDGSVVVCSALALFAWIPTLISSEHLRRNLVHKAKQAEDSLEAKRKSVLSDDALQQQILQLMNTGRAVRATDFPNEERVKVANAMAQFVKQLDKAAVNYDASAVSIAYQNAAGVARVHDAFTAAASPSGDRAQSHARLIGAVLGELGLPAHDLNVSLPNKYFSVARASAGNLGAVIPSGFPVFVALFSPEELRSAAVNNIFQDVFNAQRPDKRFGLILAPISSALLRANLTQAQAPEEVRENVVYLDETDVRDILTSKADDPQRAFLTTVRRTVRLKFIAPFITEGVTPSLVFKGRDHAIGDVLNSIEVRSFAVVGGRRIGKTSLANQVKIRLQRQGYEVFDMSCASVSTYENLYRTMRSDWADRLEGYRFEDYEPIAFREMVSVISALKRLTLPPIFILEEIDGILRFDFQRQPSEQLFRTFRDLSERRKCQFIFTGERLIFERFHDTSSPMFNFCTQVRPGLLDQDDGRKLVQEPFGLLGVAVDEILADAIVNGASRHPNLIQRICSSLVDQMDEANSSQVTADMVRAAIASPEFHQQYVEVFWGQSTPLERAISLLLGPNEAVEGQALMARLAQHHFQVGPERLNLALDYLELYCVIRRTERGIALEARHLPSFAADYLVSVPDYLAELQTQWADAK